MRAPRSTAALAVACVLALATGCGSQPKVPHGNPDNRHGAQIVDLYSAVELLRALVIASSDSYYAGGSETDARTQLERARASYDQLAGRVRAANPVLDHEVVVRFDLIAGLLRKGVRPDHYRDLAGPLGDQLMDGVSQALVPQAARTDPGVQAEALRRIALRLAATYDAASSPATDTPSRLAFEEAWGLWRRAQALDLVLGARLGNQQGSVTNAPHGRDPVERQSSAHARPELDVESLLEAAAGCDSRTSR